MVEPEDDVAALLRRHHELETELGDGGQGDFLSGWQCANPWAAHIGARILEEASSHPHDRYLYPEMDEDLIARVQEFHRRADGSLGDVAVPVLGPGSSPLLAALAAWLSQQEHREVYCIQPLYFSLVWNLKLHGIRVRPVSGRQPYEAGFTMNLPERRTVLLLADPTWYAGTSVPDSVMGTLSAWQARTGSMILIDGSFQYMRWTPTREASASLDPNLTARLICPTKALALHGHRFAYFLFPKPLAAGLAHPLSMIIGSSPWSLAACGKVAMDEMMSGRVAADLLDLVSQRHACLRSRGTLSAPWQPDSGYFVFERILPAPEGPLMDGAFFGQRGFPGFFRVNLLSPSIGVLG